MTSAGLGRSRSGASAWGRRRGRHQLVDTGCHNDGPMPDRRGRDPLPLPIAVPGGNLRGAAPRLCRRRSDEMTVPGSPRPSECRGARPSRCGEIVAFAVTPVSAVGSDGGLGVVRRDAPAPLGGAFGVQDFNPYPTPANWLFLAFAPCSPPVSPSGSPRVRTSGFRSGLSWRSPQWKRMTRRKSSRLR